MEMTLDQVTHELQQYNRSVAYGSECNAWQDYVADCHKRLGVAPEGELAADVPADFAYYWLAVAEGRSDDYNFATGDRGQWP